MCKFNNFFVNKNINLIIIKKNDNFALSQFLNAACRILYASDSSIMELTDITKVKLVIWDLDDTFWQGTLSEGPVTLIPENVDAVKYLVDHGVMNSIVSKNNFDDAKRELQKHGLWDYFVFPSIDWNPKGARIKGLIESMALRPDNVLFVDDNAMNLREASFIMPKLMTLDANDLPAFRDSLKLITKADPEHKRLKQYRILETKAEAKTQSASIDDFLKDSRITVTMRRPTPDELPRIHEMVMRTNQLNYTKDRCSLEDIKALYASPDYDMGIAEVSDKYGDYGIVGFYCVDKRARSLRHFLFSCRTLGMGIEQYVYQQLGFPALTVVGDVANQVKNENVVDWINLSQATADKPARAKASGLNLNVLVKGPCDMAGTIDFISADGAKITDEFNYVNDKGVSISGFNHTTNIVESLTASPSAIRSLVADAPMIDEGLFKTRMFDGDWDIVFFSLLPDCHEGVYERKADGMKFTFSSFNFDFTDPANWDAILAGELNCHNYRFTRDDLERLRRDFRFCGHLSPADVADNIDVILNRLPQSTTLVLLLGNTKGDPDQASAEFKGQQTVNKAVNDMVKQRFAGNQRVRMIDYSDMVASDDDAKDANHLSRRARYRIAQAMEAIMRDVAGSESQRSSSMPYFLVMVRRTIKRIIRLLGRKAHKR